MSFTMFMYLVFLSIKKITALNGGVPLPPRAGMRPGQMMNSYGNSQSFNNNIDECKIGVAARVNRIVEGVTLSQNDPMEAQIEAAEQNKRCIMHKIKQQTELNNNVNKIIQKAVCDAKKTPGEPEKKKCVSKLDKANHDCFVKNVLNDFYTSPVWKVAVHDNVAQLWYHDKLVLMIVYETVEYNIHPEEKECFTFFPTSNVAAEENALGHVVNIIGKPATPYNKTTSSCRPCTDFLKDGKTLEGTGAKCSNSCDPANLLFTASNFKAKKEEKLKEKAKKPATSTKVAKTGD